MITANKLKILRAINIATNESMIGFATPKEILKHSTYKPKNIRVILHKLVKSNLVRRPYRGCFILSEKGRKVLDEALSQGEFVKGDV